MPTLMKEMRKQTLKKLRRRRKIPSRPISIIKIISIQTIHLRLMILLAMNSFNISQSRKNQLSLKKSIPKKKLLPNLTSLNPKKQRKRMI